MIEGLAVAMSFIAIASTAWVSNDIWELRRRVYNLENPEMGVYDAEDDANFWRGDKQ